MFWTLYRVLPFFSLIWSVVGASCQPRAISLPLKRYALETRAEARGISMQIGRPNAQQMVLVPNPWYVDTYMYGSAGGFCPDDWSNDVCVTYRGGLYDSSKSQGAKVGMTLARVDDDTPSNWTLDDVKLQNTTLGIIDLPQYEFGVRTSSVNRFVHKGEIGLARNSTFLRGLANANRTSSNTWSLFWGTEVTSPQRDGSITFGGYDEAIVGDSPNITVPFDRSDDRCREGMIVEITGMTLQTTASSQDVMQGLGRQKVCIVPSAANLLTLPTRYWDRMQSIMGVELHSFRNGTAETYFYNTTIVRGASATYTGNLSITLNDALTVTVPNNQLLFGETFIAAGRGLIETKKDIISIPIVRSNDMMPRIGAMFFSVAYLMVDNDKERFTISRANPTPATQKLLGIDTANDCVSAANVVGADPTNPSDIPPSSESSGAPSNGSSGASDGSSSGSSSGISGGAIAGIVVGGVGGLALIAGIAFLFWRRRRHTAPPSESGMPLDNRIPVEKYGHDTSEMHSETAVTELGHGDHRHYAVELDSVARLSEAPAYEALTPLVGPRRS